MLIIITGGAASGKATVAQYLIDFEHFQRVRISSSGQIAPPSPHDALFENPSDFLDYATSNWRSNFVTTDLCDKKDIESFLKRPWVLLVACEASLIWRYNKYKAKNDSQISLEDFIKEDDELMYGSQITSTNGSSASIQLPSGTLTLPPLPSPANSPIRSRSQSSSYIPSPRPSAHSPLAPFFRMANLIIRTSEFPTVTSLYSHLKSLDLMKEDRVRPGWDRYFMTLASLASLRSNCMKRRVGAVLVSSKKCVISTGYNGTPRGMTNCNLGGCPRCNGLSKAGKGCGVALDECLCLHAEENALLEAGRERAGAGEGSVLYCNTCPCLRCSVKIVQCGIKEVVYSQSYSMDQASANIFAEAGVSMRQIPDDPALQ